jgi:hypothetical protein
MAPRTPQTLLQFLFQSNPDLDRERLRLGYNTVVRDPAIVRSWDTWDEFNYSNLYSKFKSVLNAKVSSLPSIAKISDIDLGIYNEETFKHQILSREIVPTVNIALAKASRWLRGHYKKDYPTIHIVRGSMCSYDEDSRVRADWSLIDLERLQTNNLYLSYLPGETKISSKWTSVKPTSGHKDELLERGRNWANPIGQLTNYVDASSVR